MAVGEGRGEDSGVALGFDSGVAVDVSVSGVAFGLDAEVLDDAPGSPGFDEFEPAFDDLESSGDEVAELRSAEFLLLAVVEPFRFPVWVAAFFCAADLLFASGSAFDRAFEPAFDALRVRPPGTVNTTSSLLPRCSTCAVAPGCSRNETTVLSTVFCAFTSANPRPRTVSARGTSLWGIFT